MTRTRTLALACGDPSFAEPEPGATGATESAIVNGTPFPVSQITFVDVPRVARCDPAREPGSRRRPATLSARPAQTLHHVPHERLAPALAPRDDGKARRSERPRHVARPHA
jgi:hypothetical protein